MKKFSNITSQIIKDEPKVEISKEQIEINQMRYGIMKLMDNLLTIRSYGSAKAELLNGSLSISGKEMFVEALIDLISSKNDISVLESLKSESKDWLSIDNKIQQIKNKSYNLNENLNHLRKIKSFLNSYQNDERFPKMLETYTLRVKDANEAHMRATVAQNMIGDKKFNYSVDKLSAISERFYQRAKELGYNGTTTINK
jgi:hypothetical protein